MQYEREGNQPPVESTYQLRTINTYVNNISDYLDSTYGNDSLSCYVPPPDITFEIQGDQDTEV